MLAGWELSGLGLKDPTLKLVVVREVIDTTGIGASLVKYEDTDGASYLRFEHGTAADHFHADCATDTYTAVPPDGIFGAVPSFLRSLFKLTMTKDQHDLAYTSIVRSMQAQQRLEQLQGDVARLHEESTRHADALKRIEHSLKAIMHREDGLSVTVARLKRARSSSSSEESRVSSSEEDSSSSSASSTTTRKRAVKRLRGIQSTDFLESPSQ